jgi:membrane protease YdiL (CAAX protease family)
MMILFTICVLLLFRRSFADYGWTCERWPEHVKTGLLCGLLLVGGAGILRLLGVCHQPGVTPPTMVEGVIYAVFSLAAVFLFAGFLQRRRTLLNYAPAAATVLVFAVVPCVPLIVALIYGRSFSHTLLTVLWLLLGAGFGEEVFYRGYIQSRLNESFGRPFCMLGIQFGAGLIVSSLLFGFLHALNSVDYFEGRFSFAWGFGIANICTGLFYGCLREATGGILAGAVAHGTLDLLVIVPGLISGA